MIFSSHFPFFIILALTGLLDLAIALFVVRENRSATNITFACWSFLVGLWSIFVSFMNVAPSLIPLGFKAAAFAGSLIPLFFLLLSLVFPDKPLSLKKFAIFLLAAPAILFGVVSPTNYWLSINYVDPTNVSIVVGTIWSLLYLAYFLVYLSAGTGLLVTNYNKSQGLRKQQFIYLFVGLFITFLFGIFCTILPVLFGVGKFLYFGPLGTIFFIALTAYAITKHELMDIRVAISRSLAYGIVGTLLILSFIGLNAMRLPMLAGMAANALLALFWAAAAHRLRDFIQTPLEEKWITGWYSSDKLINRIAMALVPVMEREPALKVIANELKDTIKIKEIQIVAVREDLRELHSKGLIKDIQSNKNGVTIPLFSSEGLEGVLILSPKTSEDPYDEKDLTVFKTIMIQAMAIFDRIRPYELIKKEFEANQKKLYDTERILARSEKIAALANLIREYNHEIKTPLGIMRSTIELLPGQPADLKDMSFKKELIGLIERADDIVESTLRLSRPKERHEEILNLNDIIEKALKLMPVSGVHLVKEMGTLPMILGDQDDLQIVFVNLIKNAGEAMPEGGNLTIKTYPGTDDNLPIVIAEVTDTGVGIPDENKEKIFEPFFSTHVTKGRGLGLSIVFRIIREHLGRIEVKSQPGKGSIFKVSLPAMKTNQN